MWIRLTIGADAVDEDALSQILVPLTHDRGLEVLDRSAGALVPEAAELPADRVLLRAYVTTVDLDALKQELDRYPSAQLVDVSPIGDEWKEGWKAFFRPTRVGRRWIVRPPWTNAGDLTSGPDDIHLVIEPGMAFGSGTHQTTRLCLTTLETHIRSDNMVLDVGCGSGILSIAAAKLGAATVRAIDLETEAERATLENADRNNVGGRIEVDCAPLSEIGCTYDVVVANILCDILLKLARDLVRVTRPGGVLIMSGVLAEEAEQMIEAMEELGLVKVQMDRDGDWVGLVWQRPE